MMVTHSFPQHDVASPAKPAPMSEADTRLAFLSAMEAVGMKPVEGIMSRLGPDLLRFRCEGDKPGKLNGWAVLHLDGVPAGAFGNYRLGLSQKWCMHPVRTAATDGSLQDLASYWPGNASTPS